MKFLQSPSEAKAWCISAREDGKQLGYVPTMGALHDGHLALIDRSLRENDQSLVSIFVNPLQFNNQADLDHYPRDMERDLALLESAGVNMVYTGSLKGFFPDKADPTALSVAEPCAAIAGLEAVSRPGHLEGVQAIVERLFETAGRCRAYFGEKDFQQTLVVRELAARHGSVEVVVCPTVREPNGLAMSSRNERLTAGGRETATALYQALLAADRSWRAGQRDPRLLEALMAEALDQPGIVIEYAAVRNPERWTAHRPSQLKNAQALVAARVEDVRLIDNLRLGSR